MKKIFSRILAVGLLSAGIIGILLVIIWTRNRRT